MEANKPRKQLKLKITVETLLQEGLVFLTGAFLGTIITFVLTWGDGINFWSTVGTMLAGLGTIGLLVFGFLTSTEWKRRLNEEKCLEQKLYLVSEINKSAFELYAFTERKFLIDKRNLNDTNYNAIILKLWNDIGFFQALDSEDYLCVDIDKKLRNANNRIVRLHQNPDSESFTRNLRAARREAERLTDATYNARREVLEGLQALE